MHEPQPLGRATFDAHQLVTGYPPRLRERNKKVVFGLASPPGTPHHGQIAVSRWPDFGLPREMPASASTALEAREDVFGYEPPEPNTVAWYLNFAHSDLFCAYGGVAFAQDELQVAEHPALASLREALLQSADLLPATVEHGQPTPVLIRGVERRCAIATAGIYGSQFARAPREVVERAVRVLRPPTVSNLIAIEAPAYGNGVYSVAEIDYILRTAYSGFRASVLESAGSAGVVMHTGFWGCGAYGGNRVLMALLQMLAAQLAAVDYLVLHTFDSAGSEAFRQAESLLQDLVAPGESRAMSAIVTKIQALGLRWGTSDGN